MNGASTNLLSWRTNVRRNPFRLSAYVMPLLIAMPVFAHADDQPASAKRDAVRMNVSAFGKLPVRFNGRVTTFAAVAPLMLTKVSGRAFTVDAKGEKQSAVCWLLDVMTDNENVKEQELFLIQNPKLLARLGFADDPRVRRVRGEDAKPPKVLGPPRFAVAELRPKLEWIEKESNRILRDVKLGDYDDFHLAIVDLRVQLHAFKSMIMVQRFPQLTVADVKVVRRLLQTTGQIDQYAWLKIVPAPEENGQWQTNLRAGIMLHASELLKKKPNPAAQSLKAIFTAYRKQEVGNFNRRLAEYFKWTKENDVARSPVSFTLPKTWRETGVRVGNGNQMFNGVEANGETIAEFDIGEGMQYIKAFVRHFTGNTMPDAHIYNQWRVDFGLMPLAESELAKAGTPITIAGHKVIYLDLIPSKEIDSFYKQTLGTVIRHGHHTFLINVGLPEVVTHHKRTFESFARSLKFASDKDLNRWFPESRPTARGDFQTTALALVPDGTRLWSFQLIERVQGIKDHSQQRVFEKLIRSISARKGNAKSGIQWAEPEDWRRAEMEAPPIIYFSPDRLAAFQAQIVVYGIGDAMNRDRLPLVNLWRIHSGLPAWQRAQMDKASRELQVAGRNVTLIKFETLPVPIPSVKPAPQPRKSELTYQVPKGWAAGKPGAFRTISFLIRDGDKQAEVVVAGLPPAAANAIVNNVNRWRAQLKLKALDEAAVQKSVEKIAVAGKTGHYIDITGTDGRRILAVMSERDDRVWFFKMTGDEQLVGKHKKSFESFVKSVSFKAEPAK